MDLTWRLRRVIRKSQQQAFAGLLIAAHCAGLERRFPVRQLLVWCLGGLVALSPAAGGQTAPPQAIILALGASNTAGWGVALTEAYPAQLEALLKAEGISATVHNFGIPGDTTRGMSARLQAGLPAGTRVVILQPGTNDARAGEGADRARNIEEIRGWLGARGIKLILMENEMLDALPRTELRDDGVHFTPRGYAILAERLLPQVRAALGR
jgi:acyl-CoA thioesterase-1